MNKLTLLLLLALPGCVSPEQFAQERAKSLAYAEGRCEGRGIAPGSSEYLKCVQAVGKDRGYTLVADGRKLAFVVPPPEPGIGGPIGGGTFYPATYVPPVYSQSR